MYVETITNYDITQLLVYTLQLYYIVICSSWYIERVCNIISLCVCTYLHYIVISDFRKVVTFFYLYYITKFTFYSNFLTKEMVIDHYGLGIQSLLCLLLAFDCCIPSKLLIIIVQWKIL